MKKFFFTFGQNHAHRYNGVTLDCDSVVQINAEDEGKARDKMVDMFGMVWGFSYSEERIQMHYYPRGVVLEVDA